MATMTSASPRRMARAVLGQRHLEARHLIRRGAAQRRMRSSGRGRERRAQQEHRNQRGGEESPHLLLPELDSGGVRPGMDTAGNEIGHRPADTVVQA